MENRCPNCGCPPQHTLITARVLKDLVTGRIRILRKVEGEEQAYRCGGGHSWKGSDQKIIQADHVEEDG